MNQYRMFLVQTSTPTPSMHRKPTEHGKYQVQNNQLLTKTWVESNHNSNMLRREGVIIYERTSHSSNIEALK